MFCYAFLNQQDWVKKIDFLGFLVSENKISKAAVCRALRPNNRFELLKDGSFNNVCKVTKIPLLPCIIIRDGVFINNLFASWEKFIFTEKLSKVIKRRKTQASQSGNGNKWPFGLFSVCLWKIKPKVSDFKTFRDLRRFWLCC